MHGSRRVQQDDHIFGRDRAVDVPGPPPDVEQVWQLVHGVPSGRWVDPHVTLLGPEALPIEVRVLGLVLLEGRVQGRGPVDPVQNFRV